MSNISFIDATLTYEGASSPSIDGLNLTIQEGEFIALVGPSGSGKSTTLRMIAGLESLTSGDIEIDGLSMHGVPPSKRNIAMVFQTYALYPHMSVRDNMGFALKMMKTDKAEITRRVDEAAEILNLTPYLERRPKELSGGQRQRVAMGRAIVREPDVFLMDEPLSNLDAKLRVSTRAQVAELQRRLGTTTVYVTHDQTEAMTMADRIAVLAPNGRLQQVGTPRELYDNPSNVFVAGFLGSPSMNFLTTRQPGIRAPQNHTGEAIVGIRPEFLHVVGDSQRTGDIEGSVTHVEDIGADAYVRVEVDSPGGANSVVTARCEPRKAPRRGSHIGLTVDWEHVHWFDEESEEVIS